MTAILTHIADRAAGAGSTSSVRPLLLVLPFLLTAAPLCRVLAVRLGQPAVLEFHRLRADGLLFTE